MLKRLLADWLRAANASVGLPWQDPVALRAQAELCWAASFQQVSARRGAWQRFLLGGGGAGFLGKPVKRREQQTTRRPLSLSVRAVFGTHTHTHTCLPFCLEPKLQCVCSHCCHMRSCAFGARLRTCVHRMAGPHPDPIPEHQRGRCGPPRPGRTPRAWPPGLSPLAAYASSPAGQPHFGVGHVHFVE